MDSFDIDLNQILNRHEKWIKLYNKNKNICNCLACKIQSPPGDESKFTKKQNMCKLHNFLKKQIKHIINNQVLEENNMLYVFDHTDLWMTFSNMSFLFINQFHQQNFNLFNQYKELVNNLYFY
jgi:hypothetical protein